MTDSGDLRRAALEAAIDEAPNDPRGYAVLADYLQEIGDPRGEFIALQLAREEHAAGEALAKLPPPPPGVQFEYANGFARAAVINPGTAKGTKDALAHPSCRFLAKLTVGYNTAPLAGSIKAIAAGVRLCLRELHLGLALNWGMQDGRAREVGDLSELWAAVPNLEELEIIGFKLEFGDIELPTLREFSLETCAVSAIEAKALARARWPNLERLTISCGRYDGDPSPQATTGLGELVARGDLPKLTELSLGRTADTDKLVEILVRSPMLSTLKVLDLSHGRLTDAGVDVFVKHRDAFAHLDEIDLSHTKLSEEQIARVMTLPNVAATAQGSHDGNADDDEHYDDVDE